MSDTDIEVEWQNMIKSVDTYAFGFVTFADAVFTLEYEPYGEDLSLLFLMPCCRIRCLSTTLSPVFPGVREAHCGRCDRSYEVDSRGDFIYYNMVDTPATDSFEYQTKVLELYLSHWGKNPLEAALLAFDFAQAMENFIDNFDGVPELPTISFSEYRTRWAPRHE